MMKWNKIEMYDDFYPYVIKSEDGNWIIAKDKIGNIILFAVKSNSKKVVEFYSATERSSIKRVKEDCFKIAEFS